MKVLVVEDQYVCRFGIESLLEHLRFECVGTATSFKEAVSKSEQTLPDVILLDVVLDDGLIFVNTSDLRQSFGNRPVVVLSAYDEPLYIAQAAALAANDYLSKSVVPDQLARALLEAGHPERSPVGHNFQEVKRFLGDRAVYKDDQLQLTSREAQVARHLVFGLSNAQMSNSMSIAIETVKEHIHRLLRKLCVRDRTSAGLWACKHLGESLKMDLPDLANATFPDVRIQRSSRFRPLGSDGKDDV